MNIEEQIKQEAKKLYPINDFYGNRDEQNSYCRSAFEFGANFGIEKAFEWISVEDKKLCSPYLAKDKQGKIEMFHINEDSFIKAVGIELWRPVNYEDYIEHFKK